MWIRKYSLHLNMDLDASDSLHYLICIHILNKRISDTVFSKNEYVVRYGLDYSHRFARPNHQSTDMTNISNDLQLI